MTESKQLTYDEKRAVVKKQFEDFIHESERLQNPDALTLVKKAFETAQLVMSRRGVDLTDDEKEMLTAIFNMTSSHRYWEKEV